MNPHMKQMLVIGGEAVGRLPEGAGLRYCGSSFTL